MNMDFTLMLILDVDHPRWSQATERIIGKVYLGAKSKNNLCSMVTEMKLQIYIQGWI